MSPKRSREVVGKDDFGLLLNAALSSDEMFRGVMYGLAFADLRSPHLWSRPDVDFEETAPRYTDVRNETGSWEYAFANAVAFAESPIEKKALLSFLLLAQVRRYLVSVTEPYPDFYQRTAEYRELEFPGEDDSLEHGLHITPQAGIPSLNARVDSVFWRWGRHHRPLVVEFDGYQWHRGNFTSDRQRDRDLRLQGFEVMRFSGAEINADPLSIAIQLDALVRETQGMKGVGE
ncbi:MAG: DUF559 domain-containing protein [Gemmatimonadaceae bacterium]